MMAGDSYRTRIVKKLVPTDCVKILNTSLFEKEI